MVRSNDGSIVPSTPSFIAYGENVRAMIMDYPDVEFVNLSGHGMYIQGMRIGGWWEEGLPEVGQLNEWFEKLSADSFLNWKEKYYIFRQTVDSGLFNESWDNQSADDAFERIYEKMTDSEPLLSVIRLKPGKALLVVIMQDTSEGEIRKADELIRSNSASQVLVINTQERLSGEKVYMKGSVGRAVSEVPDEAQSIRIGREDYPFYQMPDIMPDTGFFVEVLRFLSEQKGIHTVCTDRYSLFDRLCRNQSR